MSNTAVRRLALVLVPFSLATATETVTQCVDTADGFQATLTVASGNGRNDVIRLVQGRYDGSFVYDSAEPFDLSIEGGYTAGCLSHNPGPYNTVLDGLRTGTVLKLTTGTAASFVIDNLTVQNGATHPEDYSCVAQTGGIRAQTAGQITLRNSILRGNTGCQTGGSGASGGATLTAPTVSAESNTITTNAGGMAYAGGLVVEATYAVLRYNKVLDNTVSTDSGAGGLTIVPLGAGGDVALTGNVVTGNIAWCGGSCTGAGGISVSGHSKIVASANTIKGNQGQAGGGVRASGAEIHLVNNIIAGNRAFEWGGGAILDSTIVKALNNTVFRNASPSCGGLCAVSGSASVFNNIILENAGSTHPYFEDLLLEANQAAVYNNDFEHSTARLPNPIDTSNLNNVDPLFVDGDRGDFHLRPASPVINKGASVPDLPAYDIEGNARVLLGAVDIGAYEAAAMCTYSISPTMVDVDIAGSTGAVQLSTLAGCPWTATSNASWVTITSGAGGTGAANVLYSVEANSGPERAAALTIAGLTFTIRQSAPPAALGMPTNPKPANGAASVPLLPTLTWNGGPGANSHDVYFGAVEPLPKVATVDGTSYKPAALLPNKKYFWRVVAKAGSASTVSATWSFRTGSPAPAKPTPGIGATGISQSIVLRWTAGIGAISHDVYLGTTSSPAKVATVAGTSYTPRTLAAKKVYYWRIVARTAGGMTVSSPVWSFITN